MDVAQSLAVILAEVNRPGDFCVAGRVDLPTPRIAVKGVGPIALPLLPNQAEALIKVASRAPYGRGEDTIVDVNVRRTWQIEARDVTIGGRHWAETLASITTRVAEGLGATGEITAELYKLLIYDEGSFFVGHRDTEKAPGMFATLVVALPSASEGGALVVRHQGREARLDLANDEPSEATFAAFYADCVHEVLPVTRGSRATLVFNLVRKGRGKALQPPNHDAEAARLAACFREWATPRDPDADVPLKLVYPLEHAYTQAELGFDALKGIDAAIGRLVVPAAAETGITAHLALLEISQSGPAQYVGYSDWRSRRRRRDADEEDDADEYEIIEISEDSRLLSSWRRPDGSDAPYESIPVEDDEFSPLGLLDSLTPDEEHFSEATGNEGASFERRYTRAALVLWPAANELAVINQAGQGTTLPYLDVLITRWEGEGRPAVSPARHIAETFARIILESWPDSRWYGHYRRDSSGCARMLELLARLGSVPLIEAMLERIEERRGHDTEDNAAILTALGVFPPERAVAWLRSLVVANAARAPGSCAALLVSALDGPYRTTPEMVLEAATAQMDALPGDPGSAPKDDWGRPSWVEPDAALLADLIAIVDRLGAGLDRRLVDHVARWPQHFDPDTILVPAMKRAPRDAAGSAFLALRDAAIAHLDTRASLPLEPPTDWARPSRIGCDCEHCRTLSVFLADPMRDRWVLRAVQDTRGHVENEIRRAKADLDMMTETKGRPYSLICVKNQASHERRVAERVRDLSDLATLRGL